MTCTLRQNCRVKANLPWNSGCWARFNRRISTRPGLRAGDGCAVPSSQVAARSSLKSKLSVLMFLRKNEVGLASARELVSVLPPHSMGLETWKRQHLQPAPLSARLTTIRRGESDASKPEDDGSVISLDVPCTLRLASGWRGTVLQLSLLSLRLGCPEAPSTSSFAVSGPPRAANRSGGILLARMLFPDTLRPLCRMLVWSWCAVAGARAAAWAARLARRQAPAASTGAVHAPAGMVRRRVQQGLGMARRLTVAYGQPAALLAVLALVWARVHPTSHQIGHCIAALLPVVAGYGRTARECGLGRYGEGLKTEQAWHRRHKWAAQRLAPMLAPLPPTPPLQPLMDAWECLDISIALAMPGGPAGGGWDLISSGSTGGAGLQLSASMGTRGRGRRQAGWRQQQQAQWQQQQAQWQQQEAPAVCAVQGPGQGQGRGRGEGKCFGGKAGPSQQQAARGPGGSPTEAQVGGQPWWLADWLGAVDRGRSDTSSCHGSGCTSSSSNSSTRSDYGDARERSSQAPREPWSALPSEEAAVALAPWRPAGLHSSERGAEEEGVSGDEAGSDAPQLGTLYGRVDHLLDPHPSLTPWEGCQLALRAVQLACIFAPFLLLSAILLLLAALLRRRPAQSRAGGGEGAAQAGQAGQALRATGAPSSSMEGAQAAGTPPALALPLIEQAGRGAPGATAGSEAAATAGARAAAGSRQQQPEGGLAVAVAAAPELWEAGGRRLALRLLLGALRRSGAAFIKWGQWAATREDIFAEDICRTLAQLHDKALQHSFRHTRREVEGAFGRPVEEIFEWFDPRPLASGSIAQVHRAIMRVDGRPCHVAVKVRHPGVAHRIWQDFQLLRPLAGLTSRVRSLKGLQLKDSVAQFSHTMTAQADLRVEAAHLRRFSSNFRVAGGAVVIPYPVPGFESESVLIESFEPGASVAQYLRTAHPRNAEVVALGVDAYLQMLLRDNFVHTDLHPGNILVRTTTQEGGREQLQIVLLDFGLAEELTPSVRDHFISFLNMIGKGDGREAAAHLLQWSARQQCPRPAEFSADVEALFLRDCDIRSEAGIDLDGVMKSVLHVARKHEVTIDSNYAALVVGIVVLVGFASSLDSRVNLMDAATPCLFYYSLTGRVLGRLYM